jgi:hypothetical protein
LSALIGGQVENDLVFASCLIFSIIVSNKPILLVHMPLLLRLSSSSLQDFVILL